MSGFRGGKQYPIMDQLYEILVSYIDGDEDFVVNEVNRIVDAGDGQLDADSSLRVLMDELPFHYTRMNLMRMLYNQYKTGNERAKRVMMIVMCVDVPQCVIPKI